MALKPYNGSLDTSLKPFSGQLDQPDGAAEGVTAGDFLKAGAGSVVQAVGGAVRGAAEALRVAPTARTIEPIAGAVATAGDWLSDKGAGISSGMSQAAQRAVAGSTPEGTITDPSSWSLGTAPSLAGYALQATQGAGSIAPTLAAGIASRGRLGPSAAAAAATGGGFAAQGEQQRIEDMDEASIGQLPAYQALLADGLTPQAARAQLASTAATSAFRYTAPVSAADALLEVMPFTGAVQRGIGRVVGTSRVRRAAAGAVGGAAGEAAQEVAEGAASVAGANAATGEDRDLLEGSLANATLGAMIGGPIGGVAGLVTPPDRVGANVGSAADALAEGAPNAAPVEVQRTVVNPADGALSKAVATDVAEQTGSPVVEPVVVTTALADEQQLQEQREQDAKAQQGPTKGATAPTKPAGGGESPAVAAPSVQESQINPTGTPPSIPEGIDPETGEDMRTPEQKTAQIVAELAGRAQGMIDSTTVTAIARKLMVDRAEVSRIRGEMRAAERATAATAAQPPEDRTNGTTPVRQETLPLDDAGGGRPGGPADGGPAVPADAQGAGEEGNQEGGQEGREEGGAQRPAQGGSEGGQEVGQQAAGREAGQRQADVPDLTYDESGEQLDDDITTPSGSPWTIRDAAERAAKRHPGGRVVALDDGGFVIRTPKESPDVPASGSVPARASDAPGASNVPADVAAGAGAEAGAVDAPAVGADEPAPGRGGESAAAPAAAGSPAPGAEGVADAAQTITAGPGAGAAGTETGGRSTTASRRAAREPAGTVEAPAAAEGAAVPSAGDGPAPGTRAEDQPGVAGSGKTVATNGPWEAAGAEAAAKGDPRTLPDYFKRPNAPNARAWLRGFDRQAAAAATGSAAPAAPPRASEPATAPADRSTSEGDESGASSAPVSGSGASSAPQDEQSVEKYGTVRVGTHRGEFMVTVRDSSGAEQSGMGKTREEAKKAADRKASIADGFAENREAVKAFKKGDTVEFDGGDGRVFKGTIAHLGDADQRVVQVDVPGARGVADYHVAARNLRKVEPTSGEPITTPPADTGQAPNGDDNERGIQSDQAEGRGQEPLEEAPASDVRAPGEGGDVGAGTDGSGDADAQADGSGQRSGADGRGSVAGGASAVPDTGSRRGRRADRTRDAGRDVSDLFGEVAGDTAVQQPGGQPPTNYHIPADLALGEGGAKAKFNGNLAAIKLLKQLEQEGRRATPEEQGVLARYVGWGGIPQAFANPSTGKIAAGWEKQVQQLSEALTDEELIAARQSTQNAHYTSREVIGGVFDAVQRLGLTGGTVIEPSVGTGNFIGLTPDGLRGSLRWTAIELDSITGRIAGQLYPQAHVIAGKGFQEVSVPENHFDAAIGNPPFGQETLFDPAHPDLKGFSIHNFFFAKSLKSLRPGGVLAMVVSHSFLDKATSKQRKWIAKNARMLGAIRLPDTAFKANAGTEVTTDIVFLQKLHPGETADATWTEVGSVPDPAGGADIPLSRYFIEHPEMMLGTMTREGSMRYSGQPTLSERPGADLSEQLRQAVQHLPQNVMDAPRNIAPGETAPASDLAEDIPVYGHYVAADGKIHQRMPDVLDERVDRVVEVKGKDLERMRGLIGLRDGLKALMRAELTDATDSSMDRMRKELSAQYDEFQREFGYLNSQKNVSAFRDDADAFRLRALEVGYQRLSPEEAEAEGITMPKGRKTAEFAQKADILSRRVLKPSRSPKAATAQDALIVSLNTTGRVDVPRMAMMLGKDEQAVLDELGGKLFLDPDAGWTTDDAYLAGNVKAKLARAIAAAEQNPDFQRNVDALRGVQPADLSPADIAVGIGAPWVPGKDYSDFASEVLGAQVSVSWNGVASKFSVGSRGSRGNQQYSTSRLSAAELFERAINHQPGLVYDIVREGGNERRVINNEATTAANAKLDEIRDAFGDWIWKDQSRRERLAQFYNDNYNTDRQREFDGSFLTFPGMTDQITLRPSQKNAIWRGVQEGRYLLDHVVGAGKTYTVIATAMTAKRMGLQRKPMVTVPNHLVEQWAADWLRLYPGANVLAVTKEDFAKDRRKLLFSRIATGDWDAVIIAHSQFTRVAVPVEFEQEYLQEQIAEYESALDAAKKDRDGMTTKNLAKRRDSIKEKLKARMARTTRDTDTANLQEMGIDALYVDEAHEFKNLEFVTTKRNVSGLGNPAGSQKAADLFMKVRYIGRTYDGRGTFFATGTPVSNSLAEMFTMQRYLAESDLRARGIHTFDAWSNTFAVEESQFQIDSTGRGLKPKTVLTKFVNVAEMMAIYWRFADIVLQQDLNRIALETTGKPFPVPKVAGGRAQNVVVPAGPSLSRYIEDVIIPRTQAIAGEPVTYVENGVTYSRHVPKPDPSEDNMLKVTNDARLAALDVRLRMPEAPDDPGSKVNEATRRVVEKWKATKRKKGTQLVFCDLSTPKASQAAERAEFDALVSAAENGDEDAQAKLDKMSPDEVLAMETAGFSVYDDMRSKLIAAGIPASEIAFIHDAKTDLQKKALFNKVRTGAVRVLMGSTSKMGAGTNVQNKLVALHHLDAPWRPSDLEQREGRIIRQGNEFYAEDPDGFEVEIHRYATERTYDSRMWQLIEQKAAVVEQIRTADAATREIDDIGGQAANAAEMKAAATGNPLIIEQVELQDKAKRLGMLKRAHEGRVYDAERRLSSLRSDGGPDGRAERALADVKPEIDFIEAHPAPRGEDFTITVKGKTFTEHGKGAPALAVALVDADEEMKRTARQSVPVAQYRGMDISLAKGRLLNMRVVEVAIPGVGVLDDIGPPANSEGKVSGTGILTKIDNLARAVLSKPAGIESQRKAEHKAIAEWEGVAATPFKQAAELATTTERLREVTAQLSAKTPAADQPLQLDEAEQQGAQSRGEPGRGRQPLETEFVVGVGDLARTVSKITSQWRGDIPTVRAIESADQLPDIAKRETGWESAEGWYDGRGTIYLIANNLPNLTRAQQVLAHEAFGHYGVEGVMGSADWTRLVGQVAKLRKDPSSLTGAVRAALESTERRYPDANPGTFAREFIAVMAERGVRGGLMTRVLAALRRWLKAMRFDFDGWQDAELRDIVARGMRQVATKAAPRRADGVRGPAQGRAFHGTDMREIERFQLSKIGTGEGRDAFGWGLYFASQQDVADFYRRNVAGFARNIPATMADEAMRRAGGDRAEALRTLTRKRDALPEAARGQTQAAIDWLRRDPNRGQVYEVEVPDADQLLDWDASVDDQPEAVREKLDAIMASEFVDPGTREEWSYKKGAARSGMGFYRTLAMSNSAPDGLTGNEGASAILRQFGIPGLRYLDGDSRTGSEGTHNFVIWDEAAIGAPRGLFSMPDSQKFDAIMGAVKGADSVTQRLKDKVEDVRPALLGALTTRQLVEITGDYLPSAKGYQDLADRMAARRNKLQAEVGDLAMKWQDMQKADRRKATAAQRAARDTDSDRTVDLMHDATIAGTDPAEAYQVSTITLTSNGETVPLDEASARAAIDRIQQKLADKEWRRTAPDAIARTMEADVRRIEAGMVVEADRAAAYPGLKRRFAALPQAWQDLYREVRDAYADRADQMMDALLARIEALEINDREKAALKNRMRANFESARVHAPYFPLARFGDYWVSFEKAGSDGVERQFVMAETKRERDRAIRAAEAAGYKVAKLGRKIENVRSQDGASGSFMSEVNDVLETAGVGESVRDEIYQLYLRTLPDLSTRKNFIHRKKVAGYDQDALRAFAGQMFHGAHQLARLEYQPRLQDQLTAIVNDAKAAQDSADESADRASAGAGEFKKRHEWIMNPTNAEWVQQLSAVNFVYYLGVSPAAALVNLSQTAITSFPALASKYGWMRALNTTLATMRDAAKNVRIGDDTGIRRSLKSDDERAAYEQLQLMGAIDVTQAHDLAGLGESDTRGYSATAHKVMNAVSFLFHKAEVVNREATGIAAYRLAREAGKDHDTAVKEAADTIWQTHFDYSAQNRARFMQGNAAKVLFAFKQYSQSMTYYLWRAFYESTKGETKEVRRQARQRLVGTLGMTGVFSGVMGMPLLSLFFGTANAMAAAFGDDDEPWDAEVEFRNFLSDMLGAKLGVIAQEGLVEGGLEALGLKAPEVGSRVSLNDLWIRSADPDVEGRDLYVHLLEQAAGPIAGMLGNGITAASMIGEGLNTDNSQLVWRGVEKGMPKAVRDSMKALRYEVQGVNTLRGDPLVPDANVIDTIYQGLGLMPADLARQYEVNAAAKQYEAYVLERRQSLLDAYALATRHKDMEAVRATNEKIRAFNQRWPEIAVSAATIRRSLQARERYSERAVNGITLNSRIGDRVRDRVTFDGEGE